MWFVDQAQIVVAAGSGGRGCQSFAQPPYIRYPYPDGGNGGHGGDVMLISDPNIATLLDFHFRHEFSAGRGGHGGSNTKQGKRGTDFVVRIPVGTVIKVEDTGEVVQDLVAAGEQVIVARGGRGGLGNATLAERARLGVSQEATPGGQGEQRRLRLELKLIADVGLVGFPNAGKSSLLARISTAHPKIAPYPFTTRYPVLGVVAAGEGRTFIACDIPGLIEGAHEGRGLGIQFLRHIERTRLLVHIIDMAAVDGRDPLEVFHQLIHELAAYDASLPAKPQLVVANKMDLPQAQEHLARLREAGQQPVSEICCATGQGIPGLIQAIWRQFAILPQP